MRNGVWRKPCPEAANDVICNLIFVFIGPVYIFDRSLVFIYN